MEKGENKLQVLQFISRDIKLCMEISHVEKIIPLVLIEKIPNSPNYIIGLINYAGNSIPVIDLAIRLGFTEQKYSLDTPILVCHDNSNVLGVIIDEVIGLNNVDKTYIQKHKKFDVENSLFKAAIILNTEISLLVDINNLLNFNFVVGRTRDKKT